MEKHIPVLWDETIEGLNIREDGIYVDCTLGLGGHSSRILEKLKSGHLYCFDQDEYALSYAKKRLSAISDSFTLIDRNFKYLKEEMESRQINAVDGILFDLGVSSVQFDTASRGFSYNYDARLDMRMDDRQKLDAYAIVNEWSFAELVRVISRYGEEKYAKSIARQIEKQRMIAPIETTFQLVEIIKQAIPAAVRRKGGHPAKRTFQALRIAVNDELNIFHDTLYDALDLLRPGGRIAVITFHSLEDRICKQIFKEKTSLPELPAGLPIIPQDMQPIYHLINKKPIEASEAELEANHRAHSAKLRIIERNETNG